MTALFRRFAEDNTLAENAVVFLLALIGLSLLAISHRLHLTGWAKRVLLILAYGMIALFFVLEFFVF